MERVEEVKGKMGGEGSDERGKRGKENNIFGQLFNLNSIKPLRYILYSFKLNFDHSS